MLSLSFLFENGTVGGHVHTWVGDAWRNELLLSDKKRVYYLDLFQGLLTVKEGAESHSLHQDQADSYNHQNAVFLEMLNSGDWSHNPCDYDDGMAGLKLTLDCDQALD